MLHITSCYIGACYDINCLYNINPDEEKISMAKISLEKYVYWWHSISPKVIEKLVI